MPRFRFVAVDPDGMFRDGTIDAPDGQAARDRLAANGLKVRELEEVDPPAGEPPLFTTPPVLPAGTRGPRPVGRPTPDGTPARPRASKGTVFFAAAAIVLTAASIGYSFYRDPPWGRLSRYDFRTPEAALKSQMKMEANADILAAVEYNARMERKQAKEKLDSLEIKADKTAEFDGKKVVFYQYKQTDPQTKQTRGRKAVEWFEKDNDTGYWKRIFYMDMFQVREKNEKLAKEIEDWTRGSGD